ncbi:MAG: hypothetical protein ACKO3H_03260 [Verrucomicrobiota bacterium]
MTLQAALLGYGDLRPLWFVCGLLVSILASWVISRRVRSRRSPWRLMVASAFVFSLGFVVFLTERGPFLGRTQRKEFRMSWKVEPVEADGALHRIQQSGVRLEFVDFPGHFVVILSEELLQHLRQQPAGLVTATFDVTYDYGRARGYNEVEVAGLRDWVEEFSWGGTVGNPRRSPWE